MKKIRLDQLVFDKGLAESRERAKAYIMAGSVYVNGQKETKPGTSVAEDAAVEMRGETLPYVSRGRDIARPGVFQPVAEEGRDAHFMSVLAQRLGNSERGSKAVVAVGVRTEQNISVFHFSESFPCAA